MPKFKITAPDGKVLQITAPEGATYEQALQRVKNNYTPATSGSFNQASPPTQFNDLSHPMQNADMTTGAPASLRASAALKASEAGKENYLVSQLGEKNVYRREDGELFINQGEGWLKFDENQATLRDFADASGGAIEAVPSLIGGLITGANPAGAAAGAGAGSTLRHSISSLMPGDDELSLLDRAKDVGVNTALAGASQLGVNKLVTPVIDKLKPHNIVANSVNKSMNTPHAIKGDRLSKQTGVPLSVGQASGARGQLLVEGMLRRHPISGDVLTKFDQNNLKMLQFNLDTQLNRLGKNTGKENAGNLVGDTYKKYVKNLFGNRSKQASADMEEVIRLGGDQPIFSVQNLVDEIDNLVSKYDTPLGSDSSQAVLKGLYKMREQITGNAQKTLTTGSSVAQVGQPQLVLTPRQMQRTLEIYGKAAKGTDSIIPGVDDLNTTKYLNKQLFRALNRDLDSLADSPTQYGDAAQALKAFRDNYRANSQSISEVEGSTLGRIFGGRIEKSPEAIIDKFTSKSMKPSEIRAATAILRESDPEVVQTIKRQMIERIMGEARPAASQQMAGGVKLSPSRFNTAFGKAEENIKAVFTRKEYVDIKRVSKLMERMSDRAGTDGSPTAPLMWAAEMINGLMSLNPVTIGRSVAMTVAPDKVAQAITTAEGRKHLTSVMATKPSTKAVEAALLYFSSTQTLTE